MNDKLQQILAHVGNLPDWFDDDGDYVVWGNSVVITHPNRKPHIFDLENPDSGWREVKEA